MRFLQGNDENMKSTLTFSEANKSKPPTKLKCLEGKEVFNQSSGKSYRTFDT